MNLMKLFNFKYLVQNIKKSINKVTFIILIVSILTALVILNNSGNDFSSNIIVTNIINIIGMYIIPIAISKILFGYIFKRKSIDFIGSMPISRKGIFITNFIGGIIIILLIQLLTSLSIGITSLFVENLVVNFNMLLEFFIAGVISYIFVFSATNIAMAISGNVCTQIVVTALILFLVPFTLDALKNFDNTEECKFISDELRKTNCEVENPHEFTAPYNLLSVSLIGNEDFINNKVILKMSILSIIYFILGFILFQKRKMENTEEAFSNVYVHLIIKGLTLVPIAYLISRSKPGIKMLTFIIAIIFGYYFIYDLITKRKVKLIKNAISLTISLGMLCTIFNINDKYFEKKPIEYNVDYIKEIELEEISSGFSLKKITDKEIIEELFSYSKNNHDSKRLYIPIKIITKDEDKMETSIYIRKSDLEAIYNKIYENKEYMDKEKEDAKIDKIDEVFIYYDNLLIEGKEKEEFVKNINETYEKFYNGQVNYLVDKMSDDVDRERKVIEYYTYDNYKINKKEVGIDLSDELRKYCMEYTNNRTKEVLKNIDKEKITEIYTNFEIFNNMQNEYNDMNKNVNDYKEMLEYIIKDESDMSKINIDEPILKLNVTLYEKKGKSTRVEYYVRDIEKFISEFQIENTNGTFSNLLPVRRQEQNQYKK